MYDSYLLFPAVLIVVLIEWRRRRIERLSPLPGSAAQAPSTAWPVALFRYGLAVWLVLIGLLILESLTQESVWRFFSSASESLCQTADSQRLFGLYGCYRILDFFKGLTSPYILIPALAGLTTALSVAWPGRRALRLGDWALLSAGLAAFVLYAFLSPYREMLITAALPVLAVLLVWRLPGWGRWGRAVGLLGLAILAAFALIYLYRFDLVYSRSMSGFSILLSIGLMLFFPLVSGVVAAQALTAALSPQPAWRLRRALPLGLIAVLMLGFTVYLLYLETLWDAATDGMSQLFIILGCLFGSTAGAMLAAWALPGWRKTGALAFGAALVLLMILARSQWPFTDRIAVTERWGAQIAQAVERYHARAGHYPAALNELVPRDIWRIQRPFVYRDEDWCYQAGADFYRLAYVYRPAFGVPANQISIHVVGSQGRLPGGPWACDAALQRKQLEAPFGPPPG